MDNAPPHVHVLYGIHEAVLDHNKLRILEGSLPDAVMDIMPWWADPDMKERDDGPESIRDLIDRLKTPPELILTSPWRVRRIWRDQSRLLRVLFMDGSEGQVDMHRLMHGSTVFAPLQNESFFRQVSVRDGVITWPGGRDLAPDALYRSIQATQGDVLIL